MHMKYMLGLNTHKTKKNFKVGSLAPEVDPGFTMRGRLQAIHGLLPAVVAPVALAIMTVTEQLRHDANHN